MISGAVEAVLKAALAKADHGVHDVVVSRPTQPLDAGKLAFEGFLVHVALILTAARTRADDLAFWLYSATGKIQRFKLRDQDPAGEAG